MVTFDELKSTINTFDIIVTSGDQFHHHIIKMGCHLSAGYSDYSHIIICVRGDAFAVTSPYYSPDTIYSFEATGQHVKFVPLDANLYGLSAQHSFALCRLRDGIMPPTITPERFTSMIDKYLTVSYDFNPFVLLAIAIPAFRPLRDMIIFPLRRLFGLQNRSQCVQIAIQLLQDVGLVPHTIEACNLTPCDILTNPRTGRAYMPTFPTLWDPVLPFTV